MLVFRHSFHSAGLVSQSLRSFNSYPQALVSTTPVPISNWFWTLVLKNTLESPLDSKEIKPVNPKGNQSWIFIGRTNAEAPILWLPDVKNWLIGKDPDAGKDWRQEEKGETEDEMVRWHHRLDGHEFQQTLGDSEGHRNLECCNPWGWKVGYDSATEQQSWPHS